MRVFTHYRVAGVDCQTTASQRGIGSDHSLSCSSMPTAKVNGLNISYEVIGDGPRPWSITPGGRFSKDSPGIRQLAEALAASGNRVLIWDRPNCGASEVFFDGEDESSMQADSLAALLQHLEMAPAVL